MPSTPKLSDIWEHTVTEILGDDSKSDTGKSLRFWVKTHEIDECFHLLLWDVDDFTDHGGLSSYVEKPDSEESFHMPSTPLKQLYHLWKYAQYISSQAPVDGFGPCRSSTCHGQLESTLQQHFYEICLTTNHRKFHPKPKPYATSIKSTIGWF